MHGTLVQIVRFGRLLRKRHREDVKVFWPTQPLPTVGRHNHDVEATEFFKTFDNRLTNSTLSKIAFGDETHTCTVADWTATMKGPMKSAARKNNSAYRENSKA